MKKIVLVTGGFDPIHSGHLAYFIAAKELGDELWVGVNSDDWLTRKKDRAFMPIDERIEIISYLRMVESVFSFDDSDDTANKAISYVLEKIQDEDKIIFANGGDRNLESTPESLNFDKNQKVKFIYGVGGSDKKNSSSKILEDWKNTKTQRSWGWYRAFDEKKGIKVKELVIGPNSSLSDQRHFKRSEHWYVLEGNCKLLLEEENQKREINLKPHETINIDRGTWHKAINEKEKSCYVLEVQYGEECIEEDIERRD